MCVLSYVSHDTVLYNKFRNFIHQALITVMSKTKRVENTTVCCPIVYGSEATYLGKKIEGHASHRWKLYLRGPNNEEDLSCFVDRVLFTLHASFAVPIRGLQLIN